MPTAVRQQYLQHHWLVGACRWTDRDRIYASVRARGVERHRGLVGFDAALPALRLLLLQTHHIYAPGSGR